MHAVPLSDARRDAQDVLRWLELPEPEDAVWTRVLAEHSNRGHNSRSRVQGCAGPRPPMLRETRDLLQRFYAPWNAMLAQQLGPRFTWTYEELKAH